MRKVIEHGKYYQEKKKIAGIPYVECPECGYEIDVVLDYIVECNGDGIVYCKCGCKFSAEEEDIKYQKLR